MENTNIFQYGGFKSKSDREKLKEKLLSSIDEASKITKSSIQEDPE